MGQGPQKPDHGGNFFITPRRVVASVAWRNLSLRARAVLQVFQSRHDGFNNGHIALGIHDIGKELGDQAHGPNARAVAELMQKGFLEITAEADRRQGKVREYRLTFVTTGQGKSAEPATHDYEDWRPAAGSRRKFVGAKMAPIDRESGAKIAPNLKLSGAKTASNGNGAGPKTAEIGQNCSEPLSANIAPLLDNHSSSRQRRPCNLATFPRSPATSIGVDDGELREWAAAVVRGVGYGGQRRLSQDSGIPEPALSRFRRGRPLPDHYRLKLQEACGRSLPFKEWKEFTA